MAHNQVFGNVVALLAIGLVCTLAMAQAPTSEPPPPAAPAAAPRAPAPAPAAKVDLNAASQADLEKLPGVGEATAKKIIAGRPYEAVGDLSKAGVPKTTIEKITPLVTAGPAEPAKAATPAPATPPAPAGTSKAAAPETTTAA